MKYALILVALSTFSAPVLWASVPSIEVKQSEYPGVSRIILVGPAEKEVGFCNGFQLGQCVVTAAHCRPHSRGSASVTRQGMDEVSLDSKNVKSLWPEDKEGSPLDDLMVIRASKKLPDGYSSEVLSKADIPTAVVEEQKDRLAATLKANLEKGMAAEVVGFGPDFDAEELLEKANKLPPEQKEKAIQDLAELLKGRKKDLTLRSGKVRLMGKLGKIQLPEIEKLAEQMKLALKSGKLDEEKTKKYEKALGSVAQLLSTIVALPGPAKMLGGDSGAPVFTSKKEIVALVSRNKKDDGYYSFISIAGHRDWILKSAEDLGCFK